MFYMLPLKKALKWMTLRAQIEVSCYVQHKTKRIGPISFSRDQDWHNNGTLQTCHKEACFHEVVAKWINVCHNCQESYVFHGCILTGIMHLVSNLCVRDTGSRDNKITEGGIYFLVEVLSFLSQSHSRRQPIFFLSTFDPLAFAFAHLHF